MYVYVYVQIYIPAYTAIEADRRDAATQDAQSYGAVWSFGLMRQPARSCTDFILFTVHSSFYLFRWMMSAVFREELSLRVGPLLDFLVVLVFFVVLFFLLFDWLVFCFSFFGLECKPFGLSRMMVLPFKKYLLYYKK